VLGRVADDRHDDHADEELAQPDRLGGLIIEVLVATHVTNEGESTWFEGVQLLAVYAVLALAFFFA
jgi:calcium/proton exchanger cax